MKVADLRMVEKYAASGFHFSRIAPMAFFASSGLSANVAETSEGVSMLIRYFKFFHNHRFGSLANKNIRNISYSSRVDIAMRTEDFKRIILRMFKASEFHGYEVHKKLASEDVRVELSRLYGVLNEMLREGLLEVRWERSRFGPRKRMYRIGEKGKKELDKMLDLMRN
jgi:hypothetical protein